MNAFDILGNPVRRRILEILARGALTSGEIVEAIQGEFAISQPGVSQHLAVLRKAGFVFSHPDGPWRVYQVAARRLAEVDAWLDQFREFWGAARSGRGPAGDTVPLG